MTIDCHEPSALAEFWNDALGWGGVASSDEGAVCGPPGGGFYLEFVRVPEDKVVKNRFHFGCGVATLGGLDAEIERLHRLGASIAWEEEFAPGIAERYRNLVMRDPEGTEYCLGGGTMPG